MILMIYKIVFYDFELVYCPVISVCKLFLFKGTHNTHKSLQSEMVAYQMSLLSL